MRKCKLCKSKVELFMQIGMRCLEELFEETIMMRNSSDLFIQVVCETSKVLLRPFDVITFCCDNFILCFPLPSPKGNCPAKINRLT